MELELEPEPNRKLFPDHFPSILHGELVGAGSLWATYNSQLFILLLVELLTWKLALSTTD
jgi:hypothetical protein